MSRAADLPFSRDELNRLIIESAQEGIWIIDPEDRIVFSNPRLSELTGLTEDELIGRSVFDIIFDEDVPIVKGHLDGRRHGVKDTYLARLKRGGGGVTWVLVAGAPIHKDAEYIGALGLASDAGKLVEAEESLEKVNAEVTILLDIVTHDINNANMVAMGYLELANQTLDKGASLAPSDVTLVRKPLEVLQGASRLIDNIKVLKRRCQAEDGLVTIGLGEMLVDVVKDYSDVPDRKVVFNLRRITRCKVKANVLLRQVFVNIIGNAIKHSEGDVNVHITLEKVRDGDRPFCKVRIEDNGPGIPDDMKEKINRYRELKTKPVKGMGLYLVTTIVSDFNGRVWVEDRIKGDHTKGTRFVVMLPVVE